jgi:hypothetical protein
MQAKDQDEIATAAAAFAHRTAPVMAARASPVPPPIRLAPHRHDTSHRGQTFMYILLAMSWTYQFIVR